MKNKANTVNELTEKRDALRRDISGKKRELSEVEAALKKASHTPGRQILCKDMLTKFCGLAVETPIVVYEGKTPKKITKVIVSENHIRIEVNSNLQIEYEE